MRKSDITELPEYFDYYINLNDDVELSEAFDRSIVQIDNIDIQQLKRIGLKVYADGKWSVNKVIQHVTDWERIWCYRTLVFARKEGSIPDGNDDLAMAKTSNADEMSIEQVVSELRSVRLATKAMFETYNPAILTTTCKFYKYQMSVLAMGFNIIGHQLHHFQIINEKYIIMDV